jgi:YtcA family
MSQRFAVLAVLAMLTMTGCDPQLNIAGAYFPAWLLCMIGGLLAFWVLHLLFLRTGIIPFLVPIPLVYAALIMSLICGLWLLFFAAR